MFGTISFVPRTQTFNKENRLPTNLNAQLMRRKGMEQGNSPVSYFTASTEKEMDNSKSENRSVKVAQIFTTNNPENN